MEEFWATRVAAAVVEVDVDKESVNAKEVEGIGLERPKDRRGARALPAQPRGLPPELRRRRLARRVCFQRVPTPRRRRAALAAAACCASDVLLGELALATNDRLTWNAARVAGLDRSGASSAPPARPRRRRCARCILRGGTSSSASRGLALSLCHAALRPIDLKSTLNDLWNDAKGVQSREEAAALAKKGVRGLKSRGGTTGGRRSPRRW